MTAMSKAMGVAVLGVTSTVCVAGSCLASGGLPDFSRPQTWVLVAGAVGSALASGFQLKALFDEKVATRCDVLNDGRRTRGQVAEGFGDVREALARQSEEIRRTNALVQAALARDQGLGAGLLGAADPKVRERIAAVANSADPAIRAAVDDVVAIADGRGIEATEEALIAAVKANDLEGASRRRELGALQSLYSISKAIKTYREVISLDSEDFWTRILLSRLLMLAHKTHEAYEVAAECLLVTKEGTWQYAAACVEIADILTNKNELSASLMHYENSLRIHEEMHKLDPGDDICTHNLSVIMHNIGDVLISMGDVDGAAKRHFEALDISKKLMDSDKNNDEWRRNFALSLERVGDVLREKGDYDESINRYNQELAIRRDIFKKNSNNDDYARELAVTLSKVGNILKIKKDYSEALKCYKEDLEISRRLSKADPENRERIRDVSICLHKIGDVLKDTGDIKGALEFYEEDLETSRVLARFDPENMILRRDVLVSLWRLAPYRSDPVASWNEVIDELEAMKRDGVLNPVDERFIPAARAQAAAAAAAAAGV